MCKFSIMKVVYGQEKEIQSLRSGRMIEWEAMNFVVKMMHRIMIIIPCWKLGSHISYVWEHIPHGRKKERKLGLLTHVLLDI